MATTTDTDSISILAARRAIARILQEIETIHAEGRSDDRAGWYALDRFTAIARVAQAAADGREDAACHEYPEGSREREGILADLDRVVLPFGRRPAGEAPQDDYV